MGYRIVYGPMPQASTEIETHSERLQLMTAVFLLLFVFLVRQAWPEGTQTLRQFLLPGEPTATEAAFSDMIAVIQDGESLGDAFTVFCRQIMENGAREAY